MAVEYKKTLDVRYTADIVVAGGGPAGVAAAVTAARCGKNVIIIEQSGTFGGSSMLCNVPELMNFDDGEKFICHGFGQMIFDGMGYVNENKRRWPLVKPEKLKRLYDEFIKSSGATTLFYTKAVDVIKSGNKITHLVVSGAEGVYAICADVFVDCTGSGALCVMAGAEFEYGDENGKAMSATLCSLWGGVDFSQKGIDGDYYEKAYDAGVFSQYDPILPGIKANFPEVGVGEANAGHCFGVDDTNTESLTEATFFGRKILEEYENFYTNFVPGCKEAVLIKSADFIGIRESRRIKCEYMLNQNDFFKEEPFFDEIGRYSYPVDIHPMSTDKKAVEDFHKSLTLHHKSGDTYSIPYRCLIPKGIENILVAGRTLGVDRAMQASIRVIPGCYITGQAAGAAAAVCVEDGTNAKSADVEKIKDYIQKAYR